MARWRARTTRFEPPAWYRSFSPESWAEPDELERSMGDIGEAGRGQHQRRRWEAARHAYRLANPLLGEQEFADLIARRAARLGGRD